MSLFLSFGTEASSLARRWTWCVADGDVSCACLVMELGWFHESERKEFGFTVIV